MQFSTVHALVLLASATTQDPAQEPVVVDADVAEAPAWEFSGTVLYSDPPGSEDRLTPIVYADRGPLHLELRYNYEDLETASLFAGWTFEMGEEVEVSLTPMLGAVAGQTDGIAPGLEFDVAWKKLSWYAESEYLLDLEESDDNYFYSWSTLTYGVTDWLGAGMVVERTKLVDTDFSVQRGLALEFSHENVGLSLYAYNLDSDDDSYAVIAFELAL